MRRYAASIAVVLSCLASPAFATLVWNESLSGDLSNDRLSPTVLAFTAGQNDVIGTTGDVGGSVDRDYFSFTIGSGLTLTGLTLLDNTSVAGSGSFLAIQAGPQVTTTETGGNIGALLTFGHYDTGLIGANLIDQWLGLAALPAGTYSIWVQETGGTVDYGLRFDVATAPVPLPAGLPLLLTGLSGIWALTRRYSPRARTPSRLP